MLKITDNDESVAITGIKYKACKNDINGMIRKQRRFATGFPNFCENCEENRIMRRINMIIFSNVFNKRLSLRRFFYMENGKKSIKIIKPPVLYQQTQQLIKKIEKEEKDELSRVLNLWNKENVQTNPYHDLYHYIHPLVFGAVDRAGSLSIKYSQMGQLLNATFHIKF